jgi:hypothetical protein
MKAQVGAERLHADTQPEPEPTGAIASGREGQSAVGNAGACFPLISGARSAVLHVTDAGALHAARSETVGVAIRERVAAPMRVPPRSYGRVVQNENRIVD